MGRLLRRCVIRRFGGPWYRAAARCLPIRVMVSFVLLPGGLAALQMPGADFLLTYLLAFLSMFCAAPSTEGPAWRGFALPRLQKRYGPLAGRMILGSLWGLWRPPFWALIPGHRGAEADWLGIGIPFVDWLAITEASEKVRSRRPGSIRPAPRR